MQVRRRSFVEGKSDTYAKNRDFEGIWDFIVIVKASHFIDEGRKSKNKNHVHDLFIQLESFYKGEADEL